MTEVFASSFVDTSGTKLFNCQIDTETAELPQQVSMWNSYDIHLLFVLVVPRIHKYQDISENTFSSSLLHACFVSLH